MCPPNLVGYRCLVCIFQHTYLAISSDLLEHKEKNMYFTLRLLDHCFYITSQDNVGEYFFLDWAANSAQSYVIAFFLLLFYLHHSGQNLEVVALFVLLPIMRKNIDAVTFNSLVKLILKMAT